MAGNMEEDVLRFDRAKLTPAGWNHISRTIVVMNLEQLPTPPALPQPDWQEPYAVQPLFPGTVDVWRIMLQDGPLREVTHAARDAILRCYLDPAETDRLRIDRRPGGKPYLRTLTTALEFNLSHTRGIALVAVSATAAVGIDVEKIRKVSDPLRIARRVFPDTATRQLADLTADQMPRVFLEQWTRFEAMQKCLGRGVFDVAAVDAGLQVIQFCPAADCVACVATLAPDRPGLRYFEYQS